MIVYFFKRALSTLGYNRFRTFLTGLGVFVGVASVIVIMTFSDSFAHYLSKEYSQRIAIGLISTISDNTDFSEIITSFDIQNTAEEIRRLDGVVSFEQAEGSKTVDCQLVDLSWQYGVNVSFDDNVSVYNGTDFSCATGNVVIAYNNDSYDDISMFNIDDIIIIDGFVYRIIGTTTDFTSTFYFPERLSNQVVCQEKYDVAAFYLTTDSNGSEIANRAISMLNNSLSNNVKFINYSTADNESINSIFSTVSVFLSLIASISLIVSAINIINIMYISILERANEIAIYRSLGMTKTMVVYLFLIESFLIVFIFSLVGYIFGLVVSFLILAIIDINIHVSINSLLLVVVISIVLGIGAGIKPAINASNTNLAILLR